MKKFGAKQICGGIVAAGICLCLIVYVLVYKKYAEETDILKASNNELEAQVNDLKQYYDNMELYKKGIAQMREIVTKVTADYPGDAREEDALMMAVNMQQAAIVNYDKINIKSPAVVHSIPADTVKALNDETLKTDITFKQRESSYSCVTDYAGLKKMIEQVYDDDYRVAINTVSFKNDSEETNFIKGIIDVSYYSISGMNKEYKKPAMADYLPGVGDLFPATVIDGERIVIGGTAE